MGTVRPSGATPAKRTWPLTKSDPSSKASEAPLATHEDCSCLGIDRPRKLHHLDRMPKSDKNDSELLRTWTLTADITMGSLIRAKGILQEIQARLPKTSKKAISLEGVDLVLAMPTDDRTAFNAAVSVVSKTMADAPTLPVIPREIQDILGMKTSERHRWLADGRLPSAGTRTVRLAGRARQITFHVFDPRVVEDLLDRGAVDDCQTMSRTKSISSLPGKCPARTGATVTPGTPYRSSSTSGTRSERRCRMRRNGTRGRAPSSHSIRCLSSITA